MTTNEFIEPIHDVMDPYLRQHRFYEATLFYKVVPLWPDGCRDYAMLARGIFDCHTDSESIDYLDFRDAEVGFPAALNGVTILEVSKAEAQEALSELGVDDTPRVWTPHARYFFFKYADPSELVSADAVAPGLRFLGPDEWMPFPGTMIDGQLVHWEVDCDHYSPIELPDEFKTKPEASN